MANDRQFRPKTRYVATRGVGEYRSTIPSLVTGDDCVLEVGCEWGATTTVLARHAGYVVGVDVSQSCIERARRGHPLTRFEVVDAFDLKAVLGLGQHFNKVYMDLSGLSGYRSTLDLLALLNSYSVVLDLEMIVVKSGALKDLARRCTAWSQGPR